MIFYHSQARIKRILFLIFTCALLSLILLHRTHKSDANLSNTNKTSTSTTSNYRKYQLKEIQESSSYKIDTYNEDHKSIDRAARVRAAFVGLVRNSDLDGIMRTIRNIEDRFNRNYNYPIILLNNKKFTDEFKDSITSMTNSKVFFGQVKGSAWSYPSWINQTKAEIERNTVKYMYGGSESYRFMCRFMSGYIFRHPLLSDLDYYWRIEPDVKYHCDIDYDPFVYMKENNKVYGWIITLGESKPTIRTLWNTTREFLEYYPEHLNPQSSYRWIVSNKGDYNGCHFWSNFEIVDLSFYRSKAYMDYFNFLDKSGGFFYERWGDAPVHSIAASLFLNNDQIHFFSDIGYFHPSFGYCPDSQNSKGKCVCDREENVAEYSWCFKYWKRLYGIID